MAEQKKMKRKTQTDDSGQRLGWWRHDRFGMFIHWGLYSITARDMWYYSNERVPQEKYEKLAERFDPVDYKPSEWVALAVEAGATLIVGDSSDTDEYLQSTTIGDSNVPAEKDGDDFVDTSGNSHTRYYPRIADGTVVVITLDYDGDGGTAAADVTLVLTFAEG